MVTRQLVFDGVINGLVFGLLAMGIVLVYRSTRVINFAVGNIGLVGAACSCSSSSTTAFRSGSRPSSRSWSARSVRRARGARRDPAAVQRAAGDRARRHDRRRRAVARDRRRLPRRREPGAGSRSRSARSGRRRRCARHRTAAVDPRRGADGRRRPRLVPQPHDARHERSRRRPTTPTSPALQGINPKLVSTFVWAVAGFLATVSMIADRRPERRGDRISASLGPSTLVRALAAAVIAGMVSFPRALLAGVAIGVAAVAHPLQLPRPAGPHRLPAARRRARRGVRSRAGTTRRDPDLLVHPEGAAGARAAPRASGGSGSIDRARRWPCSWSSPSCSRSSSPAVAPPALHHDPRVRAVRAVAHGAHRLGRPAVARPDGLRRHRRAHSPPRSPAALASTSAWRETRIVDAGIGRSRCRSRIVLARRHRRAGRAHRAGRAAGPRAAAGDQHVRVRASRRSSTCTARPSSPAASTDGAVPARRRCSGST